MRFRDCPAAVSGFCRESEYLPTVRSALPRHRARSAARPGLAGGPGTRSVLPSCARKRPPFLRPLARRRPAANEERTVTVIDTTVPQQIAIPRPAPGDHAQQATGVDARDGSATCAHGVNVEHRHANRKTIDGCLHGFAGLAI